MSESRGPYKLEPKVPLINRHTLYRAADDRYETPTYEDVRALKILAQETGSELAGRLGVDARAWRRWVAPPESSSAQQIPYPAWRLLLIEFGIVEGRDQDRAPIELP